MSTIVNAALFHVIVKCSECNVLYLLLHAVSVFPCLTGVSYFVVLKLYFLKEVRQSANWIISFVSRAGFCENINTVMRQIRSLA